MKDESSENLSADIFRTLKDRIVCWEYPPWHRFTEAELCDEFGVSQTPIREVLRILVDKQVNKGYSVKQANMEEIVELYDVRLALELYIVEWLSKYGMRSDDWEKLYKTWQEMINELPGDITDVAAEDEEFHETLVLCTENKTLIQYLRNLAERIHFIRMTDITSPERYQETCEQHLAILECVKARDVACARKMIQMNIEGGRINIEHAIKEALIGSYLGSNGSA